MKTIQWMKMIRMRRRKESATLFGIVHHTQLIQRAILEKYFFKYWTSISQEDTNFIKYLIRTLLN